MQERSSLLLEYQFCFISVDESCAVFSSVCATGHQWYHLSYVRQCRGTKRFARAGYLGISDLETVVRFLTQILLRSTSDELFAPLCSGNLIRVYAVAASAPSANANIWLPHVCWLHTATSLASPGATSNPGHSKTIVNISS
jgi:hypothetical protein